MKSFALFMLLLAFAFAQASETLGHEQPPRDNALLGLAIAKNTEASQGINNMYSLISAVIVALGLILKEVKDTKKSKGIDEHIARAEEKFKKLFDYNDKKSDKLTDLIKEITLLKENEKIIASLTADVKEMGRAINNVEKSLTELVTIQKMMLKEKNL